jgi:hypothetical protein
MPKYLDHHAMPPMPPDKRIEMMQKIKAAIKSEKPDKFGVTIINVFTAPGEAWGYFDSPDAEAIVKSHEAIWGIKITLKDVVEVTPAVM